MRDPIVERLVRPAVAATRADAPAAAALCATLYASVTIADATMTLSRGSVASALFQAAVAMLVTRGLWISARAGSGDGPIATALFIFRSVMLAIALSCVSQTTLLLAIFGGAVAGPHHDARVVYLALCSAAEPALIAASLYLAACGDDGPGRPGGPTRRRGRMPR